MSITIDSATALTLFKAELLKTLTPEQREKLLGDAITTILELKQTRYGSNDFRSDTMRNAIADVMVDVVKEVLAQPDYQAKIRAAAVSVVEEVTDKIATTIVESVGKVIRGY